MSQDRLSSRIIKTESVAWKSFQYIQQDDFKEWTSEAKDRLRNSILSNNFTQPFYAWLDPADNVIYCLDGRHRTIILEELEGYGHEVPRLLPATFIKCKDKKEAAELVLIYSSIYAKITQQGLFNFINMYEIEYDSIRDRMDIPDFSIDRFEQSFDIFDVKTEEEPEVDPGPQIVKLGDLFEINGHRILCGSFEDQEAVKLLMNGEKARILNSDPPYNIPISLFSNQHDKNFSVAHGELSDEEFVLFLEKIMKTARAHTVEGAIHYIFMDWRHVWHMTEAGRRVYGSPKPKQICVWNKDMMANGSFYRSKHELCFVFNDSRGKALWNKDLADFGGNYKDNHELVFVFKSGGDQIKHLSHLELKDRIRTNVWNYPSATSGANPDRYAIKDHPTPKNTNMIADAILDTTNWGDIVIDWFLGSGTCLMSCEQTERFCYGTEIEPLYVQSIIKRYLNYCNKKGIDVKFIHENGSLTINDFSYEPVLTN